MAEASGPRVAAVAGVAAVALALSAGKWGAYLGVPPVYSSDVLLTGAVALVLVRSTRADRPPDRPASARRHAGGLLGALLAFSAVRLVLGPDHSVTALRDFAPYGYAVVGFLSARAFWSSSGRSRARTVRVVHTALVVHLALVWLVRLVPSLPAMLPVVDAGQGLHLLSLREATDATVAGITSCVFLRRWLRGGNALDVTVTLGGLALVVTVGARAALLATAVGLVQTMWTFCRRSADRRGRRVLVIGALPVVALASAFLLPQTVPGSKLLAGFGLIAPRSDLDRSGVQTAEGRNLAWHEVADYVRADTTRSLVGVGFGPDYLFDSGARVPLGNRETLRSPHNFLVNTWARLGLVGVALLVLVVLAGAREVVRLRDAADSHELVFFASVFPPAFLANALLGVELEAPFGAIPFYWCLGILLCRPRPSGTPAEEDTRC